MAHAHARPARSMRLRSRSPTISMNDFDVRGSFCGGRSAASFVIATRPPRQSTMSNARDRRTVPVRLNIAYRASDWRIQRTAGQADRLHGMARRTYPHDGSLQVRSLLAGQTSQPCRCQSAHALGSIRLPLGDRLHQPIPEQARWLAQVAEATSPITPCRPTRRRSEHSAITWLTSGAARCRDAASERDHLTGDQADR